MAQRVSLFMRILRQAAASLIAGILALGCSKSTEVTDISDPGTQLLPSDVSDDHWLEIQDDTDSDYLSDPEEIGLGYDYLDPDMDRNEIPDGPDVATLTAKRISALPIYREGSGDPPNEVYKIEHQVWGIEHCSICGEIVNMGDVEVVNPLTASSIRVPFIALHFVEHGSFSHDGDIHQGRCDVLELMEVLHDAHVQEVPGDTDGDYLSDSEELALGQDPEKADENGNWIADGIDLAGGTERCIRGLPEGPLPDQPYREEHPAYGLEVCHICGEIVNMGYVLVADPLSGLSVEVPYIAMHAMSHESFDYDGDWHGVGRADMVTLKQILTASPTTSVPEAPDMP